MTELTLKYFEYDIGRLLHDTIPKREVSRQSLLLHKCSMALYIYGDVLLIVKCYHTPADSLLETLFLYLFVLLISFTDVTVISWRARHIYVAVIHQSPRKQSIKPPSVTFAQNNKLITNIIFI